MAIPVSAYQETLSRGLELGVPATKIRQGGAARLENIDPRSGAWRGRPGCRRLLCAFDRYVRSYETDFEDFTLGAIAGQDGWSGSGGQIVDSPALAGAKSLRVGVGSAIRSIDIPASEYNVEFKFSVSYTSSYQTLTLASGSSYFHVRFAPTWITWNQDGLGDLQTTIVKDVTYKLRLYMVVADGATTVNAYLDDVLQYTFTHSSEMLPSAIQFAGATSSASYLYVDDLDIYEFYETGTFNAPLTLPAPLGAPGQLVLRVNRPNGSGEWLIAAQGALSKLVYAPEQGREYLSELTTAIGAGRLHAAQHGYYTFIVGDGFNPLYWDGTTVADAPNMPDGNFWPQLVVSWNGRIVFAHIQQGDQPAWDQLVWSDAGWQGRAGSIASFNSSTFNNGLNYLNLESGEEITALQPIPEGPLLIFTANQHFLMQASEYGDMSLSGPFPGGCVGPNAVTMALLRRGYSVYFLSSQGPMIFANGSPAYLGGEWFESVNWVSDDRLTDSLVIYNEREDRVEFVLPGAAGGVNGAGRCFALYPDEQRNSYENEWSEINGLAGDMLVADYGETDDGGRVIFLDAEGGLYQAGHGVTDGGFPHLLVSRLAYASYTEEFYVKVPANFAVEANALVGLYVHKTDCDDDSIFLPRRITASAAGEADDNIKITVDYGYKTVGAGDYFLIGAYWRRAETRAFDFDVRSANLKYWKYLDLTMGQIAAQGEGMGVAIRSDYQLGAGTRSDEYEASYPAGATIAQRTEARGPGRIRFGTGGKTGRDVSVALWHLPLDTVSNKMTSDNFYLEMIDVYAQVVPGVSQPQR